MKIYIISFQYKYWFKYKDNFMWKFNAITFATSITVTNDVMSGGVEQSAVIMFSSTKSKQILYNIITVWVCGV